MKQFLVFSLSVAAATACGRDPEAHADTTANQRASGVSKRDSVAGYVVARPRAKSDTPPPPVQQGTPPKPDTSKKDTTAIDTTAKDTTAKSDSARPPALSVAMAPGRPKKDSLSLITTLRFFHRKAAAGAWPVTGVAPVDGALLPQKRIVAFYGNPLSKRMGILGELPPEQMLAKLDGVVKEWEAADPETPVQPALHLIAVVAQGAEGKDGKYRLRMDSSLIEQVYGWAQKRDALLFLDIQAGFATVQEELPRLLKFLERPNVHLGLDPEFYMHYDREGVPPGKKIGTLTAREINWAVAQLADLSERKKIPPKILVVHRFTRPMVRDYKQIRIDPRVQIVLHMDGWGAPWLKFDSYKDYVVDEPVQFTGFKLFYKNDTKKGDKLLTAAELVQLRPRPIYIQYQ